MTKYLQVFALLLLMVLLNKPTFSQQIYNASNQLIHVQEALNPKSGHLTLYTYSDVNTVSSPLDDYNVWVVRNTMHLDYGITDNFLFGLNTSLYQDIHRKDPSNNFDQLTLTLKAGSFSFSNDHFAVAGLASFMFPFSDYQNNYGLPYNGGGNEIGLNFIFTYYTDNLFPKESTSLSINLGYYNFRDIDEDISHNSNEFIVQNSSSALNYGFGLLVPTPSIDLIIELWGHTYIQQPPVIAYSRENQMFMTFATRLSVLSFINLNIGADILLTGNEEETDFKVAKSFSISQIPRVSGVNYPEWRFFVGLEFNILPFNQVSDATIFTNRGLSKNQATNIVKKLNKHKESKDWANKQIDKLNKNQMEIEKNVRLLRSILKEN